jgi:predicted outer membrane repeat protein
MINGSLLHEMNGLMRVEENVIGDTELYIVNSKVINNRFGGIHIENIDSTVIVNSSFINNSRPIGGALYLTCPDFNEKECQFSIANSTFSSNSASVKGGAIYYDTYKPFLTNLSFNNNSAPYGPDLASYPTQIKSM